MQSSNLFHTLFLKNNHSKFLVSGVIRPISGERVEPDFSVQGETATFSLRSEGAFTPFTMGWGGELGRAAGGCLTGQRVQGAEVGFTAAQLGYAVHADDFGGNHQRAHPRGDHVFAQP